MNSKNKFRLSFVTMVIVSLMNGIYSIAQDWPQWRGSDCEGVVNANGINLDWSVKKPQLLWTFKQAGAGYSAPTIVGTTFYCQSAAGGSDFAFTRDGIAGIAASDGKLLWKADVAGNRTAVITTPIYHNNMVYATSGIMTYCFALI